MDIGLWSARLPRSQEERQAEALLIGRDGSYLLTALYAAEAPAWLREIPAIEILRRIWVQNYVWVEGQLHWRSNDDLPPGKDFINSPYDQEARYGKKRETRWTGDIRPSHRNLRGEASSPDHACGHDRCHDD